MRLSIIFCFIFSFFCNAQTQVGTSNYEAIYKVSFLKDTTNTKIIYNEQLSLLFGKDSSIFKSTKKVLSDSIENIEFENAINNPIDGKVMINFSNVPQVFFKAEVYRNKDQVTVFQYQIKRIFSFAFEEKLNWKIENETKQINNYLCRKATLKYNKRNYVAWFAESIAIPEGPYIFKGLPGLILEVYDTKQYFHFTLEGFKEINKPMIISNDKEAIKTDYFSFFKVRKEYREDPVGALQSQTGFDLPPKVRISVIDNVKSSNNFID